MVADGCSAWDPSPCEVGPKEGKDPTENCTGDGGLHRGCFTLLGEKQEGTPAQGSWLGM